MNLIQIRDEYKKIIRLIKNNTNFAIARYGDGERAIMENRYVVAQEKWISPGHETELGKSLLQTFDQKNPHYIYAISCPCHDPESYFWYLSRIKSRNITFSNIFININYKNFLNDFLELKKDTILICNEEGKERKIGNLNILKRYVLPDDCVNFWSKYGKKFLEEILEDNKKRKNILYAVSAGPISEILIYNLFKQNKDNQYIDFGSSLDEFIHGRKTRPYMDERSPYSRADCWMYDPKCFKTDITVILNVYKRPYTLKKQLEAILRQTVRPKEIFLVQDQIEDCYKIKLSKEILNKFSKKYIAKENKGVWERFRYAKEKVKTTFTCILDDDTIPGDKWLENCLSSYYMQPGLYGAIGLVFKKAEYNSHSFFRIGWANPNSRICKVDFVGHAWFLKTEWLSYLFEDTDEMQSCKEGGEDMTLSYSLQRHGINSYVPPHPLSKERLYGSNPKYANKYGSDINSLFMTNGFQKMEKIFKILVYKYGFKLIFQYDKKTFDEYLSKYNL